MTHIVPREFKTKKDFKAAVESGQVSWSLDDPSIHQPKSVFFNALELEDSYQQTNMEVGECVFCTNHPRRTWFAKVTRKPNKGKQPIFKVS